VQQLEIKGHILRFPLSQFLLAVDLEIVKGVLVAQDLAKFNTSVAVTVLVKRRRVGADTHQAWYNDHDSSTDPRFGWESDLERKLSTVVIHSATVHDG
jgi:hypothetical protein